MRLLIVVDPWPEQDIFDSRSKRSDFKNVAAVSIKFRAVCNCNCTER